MFKVKIVSDDGFVVINTETGETQIVFRNEDRVSEDIFKAIVDFVRIQYDTYSLYEQGTSLAIILQEISEAIGAVSSGSKDFRITGLPVYDPKGKDLASLHADALRFTFREFAIKEEYVAKKLEMEKIEKAVEKELAKKDMEIEFEVPFHLSDHFEPRDIPPTPRREPKVEKPEKGDEVKV